jgi:hypothetical protein
VQTNVELREASESTAQALARLQEEHARLVEQSAPFRYVHSPSLRVTLLMNHHPVI